MFAADTDSAATAGPAGAAATAGLAGAAGAGRAEAPTVAIWRSLLLPGSETFIRNQADALTRWRPTFVGALKVHSALARDTDAIAYPGGTRGTAAFLQLRATGGSAQLTRMLATRRPAIVHAHFAGDGWLVSRTAERLSIPLIITVHGLDVTRQPARGGARGARYRRNLRIAFDRAALVLAASEYVRDRAIDLGADPAKVRVHHIGVPLPPRPDAAAAPGQAAPAQEAPGQEAPGKRWDVVFVGRFVEKKGLDDLVEALGMLGDLRPRALFVGDGPLAAPIRARATALGLDATFTGALPPPEVAHRLIESRLLAAPSKTARDGDSEGLPTTILEASAHGLPVVATRHSGIPEAVVPEETGLLAAEGDRAALAEHLRRLLTDDALRARLGAGARRHVEARFNLARQTRVLEAHYDEAARRR